MRALILLLRYSGMRIGDVVNLSVDRIAGKRVFLYTQKNGRLRQHRLATVRRGGA